MPTCPSSHRPTSNRRPTGRPSRRSESREPASPTCALADTARGYIVSAKAPATVRAYRSDWRAFTGWCADHGLDSLPAAPETVALYLTEQAGVLAIATMQRRLTSISQAHKAAGHDSPSHATVVRETWKGIRRTLGVASRGKQAGLTDDIGAIATLD